MKHTRRIGKFFYAEAGGKSAEPFQPRWEDLRAVADLRRTDHVVDVGCAEGLITMEVAGLVERAHGIEFFEERVDQARRIAAERGISNVTFEAANIVEMQVPPLSYDVTLFLGVWGKNPDDENTVGAAELRRFLHATRRQLIARAGVQRPPARQRSLKTILRVCDQCSFDAVCFNNPRVDRRKDPGGNLIVANRRGTDARLRSVPGLVLIPAELLPDHPVIASAGSPTDVDETSP